jgi:hypothetical protein
MDSYNVETFDTCPKNPIVPEIHVSKSDEEDAKQRTVFYPMSLPLHTIKAYRIEISVLECNQKPYLLIKIPSSLNDKLQVVNTAMMEQLKSIFPGADISPWVLEDVGWIRFHLPKQGHGETERIYLDMEEFGIGTTRIVGVTGIKERFDRKLFYVSLVFEFHSVSMKGNVVGFTPRLLKLIDFVRTIEYAEVYP